MEFNISPIRDFLWESYEIEKSKEFLSSIQDVDYDERNEKFKHLALNNAFLFRVKRDPGLGLFVRNEIKKIEDLQENVCHIILSMFGDLSKLDYALKTPLMPKGPSGFSLKKCLSASSDYADDETKYNEKCGENERKEKLAYLQYRLKIAKEKLDNEFEITAITRNIYDHETGFFGGALLGSDNSQDLFLGNIDDTQAFISEFINRNLKYRIYYMQKNQDAITKSRLLGFVPFYLPVESVLARALFGLDPEEITRKNKSDKDSIIRYAKFEADLYTILDYEWFIKHSIDEKLVILNQEYPFKITNELVSERFSFQNNNNVDLLALDYKKFVDGRLFDAAATVAEFIYDKANTDEERWFWADATATCNRECGHYKEAYDWYSKCREANLRRESKDKIYLDFIALKNCAEMNYHLNGESTYLKDLENIYSNAKTYPDDLFTRVVWNLAISCHRTGQYDSERKYLVEYCNSDKVKKTVFSEKGEDFYNRCLSNQEDAVNYLNSSSDPDIQIIKNYGTALGHLDDFEKANGDYSKLDNIYGADVFKDYSEKIKFLPKTFQFSDIPRLCHLAMRYSQKDEDVMMLATTLRDCGYLKEAKDVYTHFISKYPTHRELTLIHLNRVLLTVQLEDKITEDAYVEIQTVLNKIKSEHLPDFVIQKLFHRVVIETCQWKNKELKNQFIVLLCEAYRQEYPGGIPELIVGYCALSESLISDAEEWYSRSLRYQGNHIEEAYIALAKIKWLTNEFDIEKKLIEEAIKVNQKSAPAYYLKAEMNLRNSEYAEALKNLDFAMEYASIVEFHKVCESLKERVKILEKTQISLNRISNKKVQSFFKTGDWLLFKIYNAPQKELYDVCPVLLEYGKGVENYVFEEIFRPVRNIVRSNKKFMDGLLIKREYYDELSSALKSLVGKDEMTISLGQIGYLYNDFEKAKNNKLAAYIRLQFEERGLDKEKLEELGKRCYQLSIERNGASHSSIHSQEEVLEKRNDMVRLINGIIDYVSNDIVQVSTN